MEKITDRLLSWASILEEETRAQAVATARMPFIRPHVALMPDAHLGKGATVGSVIPTLRALIPAAVGVDIGCGMDAGLTPLTADDLRARGSLAPLRAAVAAAVPLSAGRYNTSLTTTAAARVTELEAHAGRAGFDPAATAGNWALQLGSLGSGNHFIEVSLDEADRVWVFLHSGSRGVGNKIAQRHIRIAADLCERWWIDLPHPDLAYLVEGTGEFWAYVRELRWAQDFARLNRAEMVDRVLGCVEEFVGRDLERLEEVSCHHNYTEQERHFGQQVWLSRKGAISAREGQLGLIPGSMGDSSYVVVGRGNPVALHSARTGPGGRCHGRRRDARSPRTTSSSGWRASSGTPPRRRSSTSTRAPTSRSTSSWPTPPTSSRCATPSGRSSTSRATDPCVRPDADGGLR